MSTRKIKDAKDLTTNELIYFKGHAQATYMSDGTTVEDAINNIEIGTGGDLSGYATKEELNNKQDKLENGVNIKTINGESVLGSGNITISGGSNTGSSAAYGLVEHGTSDTTFTLTPNTFHVWDEVSALTLTLGSETSGVANEYIFQFTSSSEPTTLILPDSIKFNSDFTVEVNKIYQISILNGLGTVMSWDIEPTIQLITFTIDGTEYQAEEGMYWDEWVNSEYNNAGWFIEQDLDTTMRFFIKNNTNPNRVLYVSDTSGIIYNIKANETYKTRINLAPPII